MDSEDIRKHFNNIIENQKDVSAGIAVIATLLQVLEQCKIGTVQELHTCIQSAIDTMRSTNYPIAAIASGGELFLRFITLTALDRPSFEECKAIMLRRGKLLYKKLLESRERIAYAASKFIIDGNTILTHSKSRVVLQTMKKAAKMNKHFLVYVTQSAPDKSGEEMCKNLKEMGIECTLILDAAMGYIMEKVDMVMVGAEGVAESGGIINKIGCFSLAICAKEMRKPVYVLTECFKFSRVFPLSQSDLPDEYKYTADVLKEDYVKEHPLVDYTPPKYVDLLFTDLGIFTPAAVSDELIKLYL